MPRIYSGHPIPALRPEQSDHVPWADCPQGLSSTSARCAHPPGKSPLLPILAAGPAMSRAMELDSFHQLLERARARLFPPSKWAGLFPSAAYRRSAPPQVALGRLKGKPVGMLRRDLAGFAAQKNGFDFFFCGWHYPYTKSAAWNASPRLEYSCNTKGQHDFKSTLAFLASHEARRRMAVFAVQLAGICTRPASREALRRAAVKPRPSCMSPEYPRALWARCGVQGITPCPARGGCRSCRRCLR